MTDHPCGNPNLFDQASIIHPDSIVWSRKTKKLIEDPLPPSLLGALVSSGTTAANSDIASNQLDFSTMCQH